MPATESDHEGEPQHGDLEQQIAQLRHQLAEARVEREALLAKIHWLTQLLQGHATEKRPPKEATLLGVPVDAAVTASEAEAQQLQRQQRDDSQQTREQRKQTKNGKKGRGPGGDAKASNGGGRRPVNPELRPETVIIPVPADQRTGPDGAPLILLGYEDKEQEFYIPAGLMRLITRREILGTRDTREEVVRAPLPPAIVPRGKYHDSLVIEMMVRKFSTGIPFYRVLHDMRALGSDLSDSQLSDLAVRFAEFMAPVTAAIRAQVLAEAIAHIDETTLPTQDGGRYLWAVLAGGQVFFHVGGRGGDELRSILALPRERVQTPDLPQDRRGIRILHAMADGLRVYDTVLAEAGIVRLNCWTHVRRDFLPFEKEPAISAILDAIGKLYEVEKRAKQEVARRELTGADAIAVYTRLRHERSSKHLEHLKGLLAAAQPTASPGSVQRNAIDFPLNHWESLIHYAERGDLPIDNNDCERALKMIVVARKSWMFIGSEDAAPHMAQLFTIMESCRFQHIDPRAYLVHVVEQLHRGQTKPDLLTPRALAARFPIRR